MAFSKETIDTLSVSYTSIDIDSTGKPGTSYRDDTATSLKYSKWNGSSWDVETVDNAADVGLYSDIRFDSNDYPAISYIDTTSADLKYAKWNGSSWDIETVDSAGSINNKTSLILDSSDYPAISYYENASDLKYAKWNGSSWDIEAVVSTGDPAGKFNSLAFDSTEKPGIAYFQGADKGGSDLKYAKWNGSSWDIETVNSDNCDFISLEFDSSDYPNISYREADAGDLKFTKYSGSAWVKADGTAGSDVIDSTGDVGAYSSLELDTTGYPIIAYRDNTNTDLKMAKWNSATWDLEIVDDGGEYCSLELDTSSRVLHVSYVDAAQANLRYATETLPVIDVTGPDYTDGYPKLNNTQSTTSDVLIKVNENGTAYAVVVANNSAIPTKTQIKAGQDGSGAAAVDSANDTLVANVELTLNLTGLTEGVNYDVYVLSEDDAGNSIDQVRLDIDRSPVIKNLTPVSITTNLGRVNRSIRKINLSSFVATIGRWGVFTGGQIVGVTTGSPGVNHMFPVINSGTNEYEANDLKIGKIATIEDEGGRITVNLNGYVDGIVKGEYLIVSADAGDEGKLRSTVGATPGTYEIVARCEFIDNSSETMTFRIVSRSSIVVS